MRPRHSLQPENSCATLYTWSLEFRISKLGYDDDLYTCIPFSRDRRTRLAYYPLFSNYNIDDETFDSRDIPQLLMT
jgi:hypothetical protein